MKKRKLMEITPKGLAVISAVQNGLAPAVEGGYDTDNFERFWKQLEEDLLKQGEKYVNYHVRMFYKKRQKGA